jgi:hypothetical protein
MPSGTALVAVEKSSDACRRRAFVVTSPLDGGENASVEQNDTSVTRSGREFFIFAV